MIDLTASLQQTVNGFIEDQCADINWTARIAPNKWSAIEILGHLTDSAMVNLNRFIRSTYENGFTLTYEQNEWVAAQNYQNADIAELLTLWQLINKRIITVLSNYPPHRLQAKCNDQTVEALAIDYLQHMRHHLNQMITLKNKV